MSALTAALVALFLQNAPAQQAPPASIEGTVVKLGTNEPISGVSVELSRAAGGPSSVVGTVTTGDDGKFAFPEVAPGTYRIVATRSDSLYTPAEYGQRTPGGRGLPIELTSGQRLTNAKLEMDSTGSISGRVFDADGDPVANARVMALNSVYRDGKKVMNIIQAVRTNDLGEYRLFWLMPGKYYIGVAPQDLRSRAFSVYVTTPGRYGSREDASSPVIVRRTLENGETVEETWMVDYYGGGLDAERALPVDVRPAALIGAVDIAVNNSKVRSLRVRGVVINGATGQPAAAAVVRLVPQNSGPHMIMPNAAADKTGAFDIGGVVPGSYSLVAAVNPSRGGGQGETFFDVSGVPAALIPLKVADRDIENLTVTLRPAFSIQGRILVENSRGTSIDLTRIRARLTRHPDILGLPNAEPRLPTPNAPANGVPSAEGAFTLRGFSAGDYRVNVAAMPENYYVKSIRLGNVDVLTSGLHVESQPEGQLEVTIAADGAGVEGVVVNAKQEPVANATLVLVPEPALRSRLDLYKTVPTGRSGRFRLSGIPPGDYELYAWEIVEADAWLDPAFMRTLEGKGQLVHLDEGGRNQIQITVLP